MIQFARGYLSTFALQAVIGAAVAIAAFAQYLVSRRRGTLLWMLHWLLLAGGQAAGYVAASDLAAGDYGSPAVIAWSGAVAGFFSSSVVLLAASRATAGATGPTRWFHPSWVLFGVLGVVAGTWAVHASATGAGDFIARGGVFVRVVNIASALAGATVLRRSAVWREEPGVRVLGWALVAVAGRAVIAVLLGVTPAGALPAWTGNALVGLQVTVQIWFAIGTITAILSLDRMERAAAGRRMDDLERAILQAQRQESLGQMASGVAHDFRNILTVVRSSAELALEEIPADSPAGNDLREIMRASDRGAELTTQLLAFARGSTGTVTTFDVTSRVQLMRPMLARLLPPGVKLETDLDPSSAVTLDPLQFDQVLLNLVVNARDAIPAEGRVSIGTARTATMPALHPDGNPIHPGPFVRLRVSDTGVGIPADVLPRIFERFFTTKPANVGTGLGLPTCYTIARRYGGTMTVSSAVGRGTEVDVFFPSADAALANTDPAGQEPVTR